MFYSHSYRGKTDYNHKQKMFERGRRRGAYISEFLLNSGVVVDRKTVVYEVGCGYGGILDYFRSQYDCTVLGSDIDASINDFSLEKGLDIKKGSLEVFSKGKADIIILSHILEHISSPLEFLKNLKNLMRENGVIYVEVPGIKHPKVIDGNLGVQPGHLLYFDKNTAINTFKEAGYKVVTSNEVVRAVLS
jgi:2-polyprenyl-3-methyl-5-hydroxy-6-metoxy-1,4-benzoquinol methylase